MGRTMAVATQDPVTSGALHTRGCCQVDQEEAQIKKVAREYKKVLIDCKWPFYGPVVREYRDIERVMKVRRRWSVGIAVGSCILVAILLIVNVIVWPLGILLIVLALVCCSAWIVIDRIGSRNRRVSLLSRLVNSAAEADRFIQEQGATFEEVRLMDRCPHLTLQHLRAIKHDVLRALSQDWIKKHGQEWTGRGEGEEGVYHSDGYLSDVRLPRPPDVRLPRPSDVWLPCPVIKVHGRWYICLMVEEGGYSCVDQIVDVKTGVVKVIVASDRYGLSDYHALRRCAGDGVAGTEGYIEWQYGRRRRGIGIIMPKYVGTLEDCRSHHLLARKKYASDVFGGLMYMHSLGIVHCNLNLKNIFITSDGQACIAGFKSVRSTCEGEGRRRLPAATPATPPDYRDAYRRYMDMGRKEDLELCRGLITGEVVWYNDSNPRPGPGSRLNFDTYSMGQVLRELFHGCLSPELEDVIYRLERGTITLVEARARFEGISFRV